MIARQGGGFINIQHLAAYDIRHENIDHYYHDFHAADIHCWIYGMNFEHMPELKWRLGYPHTVNQDGYWHWHGVLL